MAVVLHAVVSGEGGGRERGWEQASQHKLHATEEGKRGEGVLCKQLLAPCFMALPLKLPGCGMRTSGSHKPKRSHAAALI
jgi:hypothetical protein